jgi:hypothetical protein
MNEPTPAFPETEPPASAMSLFERLTNVIASPGEVFEFLRDATPSAANWLVPISLLVVLSWIGSALIFAQPAIKQQISDMQTHALDQQVEKGKLTREQAEQARASIERFGEIGMKVAGYGGALVVGFVSPLWWGLLIWLVGTKACGGSFLFGKGVEAAGLSLMIDVLDAVVRTLLILVTGNLFAALSPVLLVGQFDPSSNLHNALATLSVMTFWSLAVKSVALSRLARVSFGKAAAWLLGLWALFTGLMFGLGVVSRSIFGG